MLLKTIYSYGTLGNLNHDVHSTNRSAARIR